MSGRSARAADPGRTSARRRLLLIGVTAVMVLLAGRAFELQVMEREEWRHSAEQQQARQRSLPAPRGTIYDRDGVPLAASEETFTISVAPRELRDRKQVQRLLQKHAGLTLAASQRAVDPRRSWVVLPGRFNAQTRQQLHGQRGLYIERVLRRFYPRGPIATELVGAVTADGNALSGLELEFNSALRGREGRAVTRRAASGPIPGALHELIEPAPGHDLVLTVDADMQEIAREALAHAIQETGAASGEILMSDPRTGEILAAVTSKAGVHAWRAVTEPYEPGSTLKPFAVATLLAEKQATLDDSVFAENGEFKRDGRTIRDVHAYGWLTVADALKHSSNIALAKLSDRLVAEVQYSYLRAFGFGSPTGVSYPSESGGLLRRPDRWSKFSRASLAIGYEISVTPLQMLMAYGALANGGVLMEPRLVREVRSREGKVMTTFAPRAVRRAVPERTADELRAVLTDVVEAGTGQAADLGPFAVAGKTGTARAFGGGITAAARTTALSPGFFRRKTRSWFSW
jgi:cell division protein FtsI (penicillin-binding protein 3)